MTPKISDFEIFGTLSNLFFSYEKKFDIEHHFNTQNDRETMCRLSDGLGSHDRAQKSPLFFVDQWVKLNQQNYQDGILVGALLP